MLVLFVFLNALAGGATIIETRRLGMYERMAAAPHPRRTIILGESLTYFCIALVQADDHRARRRRSRSGCRGATRWQPPRSSSVWAMVGAGGDALRAPSSGPPSRRAAIGPAIGIALAMLGGCMWPL